MESVIFLTRKKFTTNWRTKENLVLPHSTRPLLNNLLSFQNQVVPFHPSQNFLWYIFTCINQTVLLCLGMSFADLWNIFELNACPDWHSSPGNRLHLLAEGGSPQRPRAGGLHRAEPPRGASDPRQPAVEHLRSDGQARLDQLGQPGHLLGKELLHWRRRGHAEPGVALHLRWNPYQETLSQFLAHNNSSQRSVILKLIFKH